MDKNKEFTEELDKVVQSEWKEAAKLIKDSKLRIISFSYSVLLSDDILKKYSLTNNIEFIVDTTSDSGKIEYYYKGMKLEPVNYYLRPDDYHEVSTLSILQQCTIQDTYKPDIMFLERGETCK